MMTHQRGSRGEDPLVPTLTKIGRIVPGARDLKVKESFGPHILSIYTMQSLQACKGATSM